MPKRKQKSAAPQPEPPAPPKPPKPDRTDLQRLQYTFSDPERAQLGLKLARQTRNLDDLADQKKEAVAGIMKEIEETRRFIKQLTNAINDGWEYRPVEVATFLNSPQSGIKQRIRLDTGELLSEEPMTAEERQQVLPGMTPAPPAEEQPVNGQEAEPPTMQEGICADCKKTAFVDANTHLCVHCEAFKEKPKGKAAAAGDAE